MADLSATASAGQVRLLNIVRAGSSPPLNKSYDPRDFSAAPSLRTPSLNFSSSAQNEIRRKPLLSSPNAAAVIVTTPCSSPASATFNSSPYLLTSTIV